MKKTYLFVLAVCCSLGMLLSGSAFGQTYTNATPQTVGTVAGEYTPYSTDIVVAGGPLVIENMSVTLSGVSHTWVSDMDVMLVAPNGDNFIFMSDAIGGTAVVAVDYTFGDYAAAPLDATSTTSGVYLPTNIDAGDGDLQAPAPVDQGNTDFFGAFGGDDANGTWSIFVWDDTNADGGDLTGWEISFFPNASGCTDGVTPACNYDPAATVDDGSCDYSCIGCLDDGSGVLVTAVFPGIAACDFDPLSTIAGPCDYSCIGCTDPAALNTTPGATVDDGSCITSGCVDAPVNFQLCYENGAATVLTLTENNPGEGVVLEIISGGTEGTFDFLSIYDGADNLSPILFTGSGDATGLIVQSTGASITIEILADGSVSCGTGELTELDINAYCTSVVLGCTDDGTAGPFAPAAACNYDPAALNDDGSCEYASCAGCTDALATNFTPGATIDDGSCITCAAGELLVTVDMRDSFGDGWNGHEYILSDSGGIIGQNDLDNALTGDGLFAGSDLYCLAPGCYFLDFIAGGFVNEIGYTISDNVGNTYLDLDGAIVTGQGLNIGLGNACGFAGCIDPTAINYDINADTDDGSCLFPAANDEICNAEAVACGSSITGTTALSSDAEGLIGSTCSGIDITSTGVWYEFNALAAQQIFLSSCSSTSGIDTKIHVYEAADCNSALTCVAGNDDSGSCPAGSFLSEVVFNANAATTYFIYVSEFGAGAGLEFNLDVTCVDCVSGVPTNDDCSSATPVPAVTPGVEATATQSICCASPAVENDFAPAFTTTYDVWFVVNSGTFDALAISLRNVDSADLGITIYDGADCLALNSAAGGGPVVEEIAGDLSDFVTVTPSTDYLIQAWTTDPSGCGDITIGVTGNNLGCTDASANNFDPLASLDDGSCDYTGVVPANDECANAEVLVCNTTVAGSTGGATAAGVPLSIADCNASPGTGVWYTFVGTGELHTLTTCGSVIDSQINVYESDADCAGVFTCAASATEGFTSCGFFDQDDVQVEFISTVGLNYYVYVGAEDVDGDPLTDDNGSFDLTFDCAAAVPGCTEVNACNYDVANNIDDGSCDYFACACDANPTGTAVQLQMEDSFGDGWGTGTYEVFNVSTGTSVATGTLDDALVVVDEDNIPGGDNGFDMLCLDDGCYEIVVGGDTFDFEISWSIVDAADAVIASGIAPETVSFTIGAAVCGCTDDGTAGPFAPAAACNFDPLATDDDGSCEYESCAGCTSIPTACNFDATALIDDGSCCEENCVTFDMTDQFADGWDGAVYTIFDAVTDAVVASGDIDTADEGDLGDGTDNLCLVDGCYYLSITEGDFPGEIGWVLSGINGGIETGGAPVDQLYFSVGTGDCVVGCATEIACNYDAATIIEDCTLCEFTSCVGCTYATAENQTAGATIDDGSCTFATGSACPADFNEDGIVNAGDLLAFLGEFGTTCP